MKCSCQEVAENGKQKVEESLAMQLLHESQKNAKRWFVAWLISFLLLLTVLGGIIYIALTSEFSINDVEQNISGNGYTNYVGNNGDINNGSSKI